MLPNLWQHTCNGGRPTFGFVNGLVEGCRLPVNSTFVTVYIRATTGAPVHPMHPAHSMQMAMPGPGHFGMPPFRPPGVPMGPPAARPPGADLDALLSKQTVQGRAKTERYIIQIWLLRLRF